MADLFARDVATPAMLAALFSTVDAEMRRVILARPAVRAALWRSPANELRAKALREASLC